MMHSASLNLRFLNFHRISTGFSFCQFSFPCFVKTFVFISSITKAGIIKWREYFRACHLNHQEQMLCIFGERENCSLIHENLECRQTENQCYLYAIKIKKECEYSKHWTDLRTVYIEWIFTHAYSSFSNFCNWFINYSFVCLHYDIRKFT